MPEKLSNQYKAVQVGWKLDHVEIKSALDKYFEICSWDVKKGNATCFRLDDLIWVG
jgi:hypothetical protein